MLVPEIPRVRPRSHGLASCCRARSCVLALDLAVAGSSPLNIDVRVLFSDETDPANVRVTYSGQQRVRLDEHGEWDPIIRSR